MTRRQLGFVFGVLAALSAVWISVRERDSSPEEFLDLGALIDRSVSQFRISQPDSSTARFQLIDGHWTVNGYPAEDSLVENLLAQLDTLPQARLVARSPATHERLGVAVETALRVEIGPTAKSDALFLLLGNSGPEGRFVRLSDRPEVFVISEAAGEELLREAFLWRNPTIVTVDTASLSRIVIHRGSSPPFAMDRDELGAWLVDGIRADTTVMSTFFEMLADFRATGFPADSFVYAVDFDRPDAILDLHLGATLTDVPTVSLLFASVPTRNEVLVRRADNPIVYAVDSWRANFLTAGRTRFLSPD